MSAETLRLPFVPQPILAPAERAALSEAFRDPAFWEWFERQPEPSEEELAPIAAHEATHP